MNLQISDLIMKKFSRPDKNETVSSSCLSCFYKKEEESEEGAIYHFDNLYFLLAESVLYPSSNLYAPKQANEKPQMTG